MPSYDLQCKPCRSVEEVYLSRWSNPTPPCPKCGGDRERMAGRFAMPLTGSIRKYADLKREGAQAEGFWAYKKVSSVSGQPEPVYLTSMEEVRAFNRAEGLADPAEVPTNSTISSDGKRMLSTGMPGQWQGGYNPDLIPSRLWEMDKSLTSLNGNDPAPVASGPPCTIQAVDVKDFASQMEG